jgi:hypothetical protein
MERNKAYYQLGIYKEKFKEYELATNLEQLLQKRKLILPAMYNLYKIHHSKRKQ